MKVEQIWHPWHLWECYPAGFYNPPPTDKDGAEMCCLFLSDLSQFQMGLRHVVSRWPYSCEHNLTNSGINRIAWLGQASVCIELGIPSSCKRGFSLLLPDKQRAANKLAKIHLNHWLRRQRRKSLRCRKE